jgi:hypothetical protein
MAATAKYRIAYRPSICLALEPDLTPSPKDSGGHHHHFLLRPAPDAPFEKGPRFTTQVRNASK